MYKNMRETLYIQRWECYSYFKKHLSMLNNGDTIFRKRMVIKLDNKRTTNGTIVEQGK